MNKTPHYFFVPIFAALIILLALGGALFFKSEKSEKVVYTVSLFIDHAQPQELMLKVGEFVQFNSKDGKYHNISSGKGNDYGKDHDHVGEAFVSGVFGPDEGYLLQFKKAGIFYFHDDLNPKLFVTVVVYSG